MIVSLDALAENGRAQLMILDKTLKQLRAQLAASKVIQKKAGRPASRAAKEPAPLWPAPCLPAVQLPVLLT